MKLWVNIFRGIILIIGIAVLSFDALFYSLFEQQKKETDTVNKQQQIEEQVSSNKFKYQQQQIYYLSKDLRDTQQAVKDQKDVLAEQKNAIAAQKDALLQEIVKRQEMENESQGIQTSLIDIKAEADAIKQDMKGWQKDYVSVLADLEKKMDDSQDEMKSVKESINSLKADIEKISSKEMESTAPSESQLQIKE